MSKIKGALVVLDELWGIADEMGHDYIYRAGEYGCSYVGTDETKPGCIVGHWLHKHGVSLANLESNEGPISLKWYDFSPSLGFNITQTALSLLREVQMYQDAGRTWGRSIQMAAEDLSLV